jgi:Chlorophyll A-B binding protein
LDRSIAEYFGVLSPLDDADRVPSILNGGLDKIPPAWWGFCLGMTAAIDSYGIQRARSAGSESGYTPGDLGWDPLSLYPLDKEGKMDMQLKEIKHGRVAMLAVVAFSAQEYSSKLGVVDETPFFFHPITETAETFLQSVVMN